MVATQINLSKFLHISNFTIILNVALQSSEFCFSHFKFCMSNNALDYVASENIQHYAL